MANIWMNTQKDFNYHSLRWGLGLESEKEAKGYFYTEMTGARELTCPKIFTTRLSQLHFNRADPRKSPVYNVVKGARYGAKPLDPPIRFQVERSYTLFLKSGTIWSSTPLKGVPEKYSTTWDYLNKDGYTFPELDLGFRGATWEMVVKTLLALNKKATVDSQFVVNVLKPVGWYL